MTLEEAIRILRSDYKDHHSFSTDVVGQAEKLGIAAFELIEANRIAYDEYAMQLLPGETKD